MDINSVASDDAMDSIAVKLLPKAHFMQPISFPVLIAAGMPSNGLLIAESHMKLA
jgi:hypothetical protein